MRPITKIFAGIAFMSSMATVSYSAAPSYKAIQDTTNNTFTTGDKTFLLNGKPFVVKAAEIHYHVFRARIGNTASRCAKLWA